MPSTQPHRLRALAVVLISTVVGSIAQPAAANIASTTGAVSEIAHPVGTLASGTLESSSTIYTWFESRVSNPGSMTMDDVGPGTVTSAGSATSGTINPGFAISYMIHFDPVGTTAAGASGSITFSGQILGVWFNSTTLGNSDATFSPVGLTYGSLTSRGYELGTNSSKDRYSISTNGNTLTIVNSYASGATVDQMRVLVSPEPGTGALLGIGTLALAGLVLRRRSRRKRLHAANASAAA